MILRYPKYYEDFSCIADKCEDTCCAGWEIDIDDKSYEYYMSLSGEFGDYVRSNIKEYQLEDEDVYEAHGFILREEKRCPFLNENNLCEMILTLGEDAICDVCTYTPRNFLEYGNAREISISPSCAEAGRLIFGSDCKVTFVEKEIDEALGFEESEEDLKLAKVILWARNQSIDILQDRTKSIYQRMCLFLQFAYDVQQKLNVDALDKVYKVEVPQKICSQDELFLEEDNVRKIRYSYFVKRMQSFSGMESINEEWQQYLESLQKDFMENENGFSVYNENFEKYTAYLKENDREYEYEQMAVYYAFLSLSRCVDDLNFFGKAQFLVANFLMIRDMDIERFYQKSGVFLPEDRVDIARIYAKEVEHSQDNLEYLDDEFLFEDIYRKQELCHQILPNGKYSI